MLLVFSLAAGDSAATSGDDWDLPPRKDPRSASLVRDLYEKSSEGFLEEVQAESEESGGLQALQKGITLDLLEKDFRSMKAKLIREEPVMEASIIQFENAAEKLIKLKAAEWEDETRIRLVSLKREYDDQVHALVNGINVPIRKYNALRKRVETLRKQLERLREKHGRELEKLYRPTLGASGSLRDNPDEKPEEGSAVPPPSRKTGKTASKGYLDILKEFLNDPIDFIMKWWK